MESDSEERLKMKTFSVQDFILALESNSLKTQTGSSKFKTDKNMCISSDNNNAVENIGGRSTNISPQIETIVPVTNEDIKPEPITFTPSNIVESFYRQPSDQQVLLSKPWRKSPHYFKTVHISILALTKMTIHARSGGSIEIMGMMTGKVFGREMVVLDCYPLPVEGTETRVNAQNEAYEFLLQYLESLKKLDGRDEDIIGWYHSHPGFGCWLSGIDVQTQSLAQGFQDPYVAIVIDPERTIKQESVEIAAFRTYYEDCNPNSTGNNNSTSAKDKKTSKPKKSSDLNGGSRFSKSKEKDFGHHADKYYSLNIKLFKNEFDDKVLDLLKSQFWFSGLNFNSENAIDYEKNNLKLDSISKLVSKEVPLSYKSRRNNTISSNPIIPNFLKLSDMNKPKTSAGDQPKKTKTKYQRKLTTSSQSSILAANDLNKLAKKQMGKILMHDLQRELFLD
ncbi:hypothetical protein B5S28_g2679 [[Candida] boidinii]|nr:hypothetical protein B5S28_g2679 [[Candida] boidinii]OWB59862.1 hypothetical protein B5S29_g727 [[Candida] boidinii]OWB79582.1 hypothetical protein B5S32_g3810 [[Candida] boidinii]